MDVEYKCSLSDACMKQAKEELNEDLKTRTESIIALKEWLKQQPHLVCRTDTDFLLRFLRTAKFSQQRARDMVEGYLALKIELPHWYSNWNPLDPDVAVFFKAGLFVPLPGYYKNGVKIYVHRYGALGKTIPKQITKNYTEAYIKCWYMLMYYAQNDENVQGSGLLYIMDYTDFPMEALSMFTMTETKDIMRYQDNTPGRFKGFWVYNEGIVADMLLSVFRPFMKKKMLDRFRFFGRNLEKLYEEIPKSMLPIEYLPDDYNGPNAGSFDSLAEKFYQEISTESNIRALMYESDPKWGNNKSQRRK